MRPLQFPLKSYGFPGAETARKRFLLWKMGFSAAVYCEPMHPSSQHGRSTALASSLAVLPASLGLLRAVSPTGRALRASPPYTPPGTIKARKGFGSTIRHGRSASLASSLAALPTSLGLLRAASPTGRALRAPLAPPAASRPSTAHFVCSPLQPFGPPMFASSLAAFLALLGSSYRPALRWPGIPGLRSASRCSSNQHGRTTAHASSLAALPASLGLLRPVSRTARGLRAPLAPPPLRGFDGYGLFRALRAAKLRPHWAYFALFRAQRARFVRHSRTLPWGFLTV